MERRAPAGRITAQDNPHVIRFSDNEVRLFFTGRVDGHNPRGYHLQLSNAQLAALAESIATLAQESGR